jgi:hypothetical protein
VFKNIKNNDKLPAGTLFQSIDQRAGTRKGGSPWCVQRKFARTEVRQNSFGPRVAEKWNALPPELQGLEKVESFKKKLREEAQ